MTPGGGVRRRVDRTGRPPRRRADPGRVDLRRRARPRRVGPARSRFVEWSTLPRRRRQRALRRRGARRRPRAGPRRSTSSAAPAVRSVGRRPTAAALRPASARRTTSLEGFEGPHDAQGHRSRGRAGRSPACPWRQAERGRRRLAPGHPRRPGGLVPQRFRRDLRGAVPDLGLRLRRRPSRPRPRSRRGRALHLLAATATRPSRRSRSGCGCIEGAEACFATASGMAAVFVAMAALVRRGRPGGGGPRRCSARASSSSTRSCRAWASTPTSSTAHDLDQWREALVAPGDRGVLRDAVQPDAGARRHRGRSATLAHAAGAQVVVDNVFATPVSAAPLRARRRRRRLLGDQAHRRPGAHARRRGARAARVHRRPGAERSCGTPARRCRPFNAWVLAKGLETMRPARRAPGRVTLLALASSS